MKTKTAFFLVLTLLSGLAACGGGGGGGSSWDQMVWDQDNWA